MQRKRSAAAQDKGAADRVRLSYPSLDPTSGDDSLPPIILKSQLYTVLADKTAVDRDVEQLRQQGRARLFKLAFGADEDRHAPDSLMFTVSGAAAFVKSVVAGRQELLQMLKRKKYQEVLEKELMCVALRGSCLTPAFHVRDLQGRGLVACMDTTAGRLVRLAQRK
ncbi:hypothetical protein OEZ85_013051 [Tetradesmus obliquus]|uniref:Uncharacterized protein n=1 Tax=Tetradesmus obliquus TaxID=3088 RepID=A0ABY8U9M8_TETOB|nr:hypothetical protein OEZ85_013051 [Tetradesmus obliquus]